MDETDGDVPDKYDTRRIAHWLCRMLATLAFEVRPNLAAAWTIARQLLAVQAFPSNNLAVLSDNEQFSPRWNPLAIC